MAWLEISDLGSQIADLDRIGLANNSCAAGHKFAIADGAI